MSYGIVFLVQPHSPNFSLQEYLIITTFSMPLFKTMDLLDPSPPDFYLFSAFIMSFKKGNLLIIKG